MSAVMSASMSAVRSPSGSAVLSASVSAVCPSSTSASTPMSPVSPAIAIESFTTIAAVAPLESIAAALSARRGLSA